MCPGCSVRLSSAPAKRPLLRGRNPPGPSHLIPEPPLCETPHPRWKSSCLVVHSALYLPCTLREAFSSSLCGQVLAPRGQGFTIPVSPGCLDHRTVGLTDLDDDICSGIFQAQQLVWVPEPQLAPNLSGWNSSLMLSGCLSHSFGGSHPGNPGGRMAAVSSDDADGSIVHRTPPPPDGKNAERGWQREDCPLREVSP